MSSGFKITEFKDCGERKLDCITSLEVTENCDVSKGGDWSLHSQCWIVSGHADGLIRIWNLQTSRVDFIVVGLMDRVEEVRISVDRKRVASWSFRERKMRVW
jgi:WD40 repeat protein